MQTLNFTDTIKLVIKGKPISKDNQKRSIGKNGRYFTRPEYRDYEESVRDQAFLQLRDHKPLDCDLFVMLIFFFPNKKHCDLWNAPKSVGDALNGIVWKNDKQVKLSYLQCLYDKKDPRVEIYINKIN